MYIFDKLKSVLPKFFTIMTCFPFLPKRLIFVVDLLIAAIAFFISYWVFFDLIQGKIVIGIFLIKLLIYLIVTGVFFFVFKTQTGILRYSTFLDALRIFSAVFFANLTMVMINKLLSIFYEHSILSWQGFFINFVLAFSSIFFFRMAIRLIFDYARISGIKKYKSKPLLIYGTGSTSIGLAKLITASENLSYHVTGFISSDHERANKKISNHSVYYRDDIFKDFSLLKNIKAILIYPKEIDSSEKQFIADKCLEYKIDLLSAPAITNWKKSLNELEKVNIEDLLGRPPNEIDIQSIGKNLNGKTVLVTGAAGSIGGEIVRQICRFDLKLLLVCDVAESPLHGLMLELQDDFSEIRFVPVIGNVRDYAQMKLIFEKYKPDYVYHAAAYKHVPLMEMHPCEAILTNVLGSRNIADLSVLYHAEVFVMVSTDKAVNPTNVMGASKRIAEMYVQSLSKKIKNQSTELPHTRIITTRFGNVLGSNGSVIPRFEAQIKHGGPVTVTHPDVIRYFMTIPEACRLVLEAGNFGEGGEVFIFDMGESIKIKDMAEKMIRLSGLEPHRDIKIEYTGLRPGEKLYEELLYDKETVKPTHNPKIKIGSVREYDYEDIAAHLKLMIETAQTFNPEAVVGLMKKTVPEFISQNSLYEKLDKKQNNTGSLNAINQTLSFPLLNSPLHYI